MKIGPKQAAADAESILHWLKEESTHKSKFCDCWWKVPQYDLLAP